MTAEMVGTIAGSPMPFTPSGPIGSRSSTMMDVTCGTSRDVGRMYLGETRRRGVARRQFVVSHQTLAERLDDAAFDLTFDAARIDRAADVMGRPDAEHLHLARQGIDFDFGDLASKHIGLPRRAAAIGRAETGVVSGEVRRSDWNDAAFFDVLDGLRHRLPEIGLRRPDKAVAGLDLLRD